MQLRLDNGIGSFSPRRCLVWISTRMLALARLSQQLAEA
jgi:hypothetical protein